MQKTVDVSELTEEQKANLVQEYLTGLTTMYEHRAKALAGEDPGLGLVAVLEDKAQEVERLKSWVGTIINQHIGRRHADQMNQAAQANRPLAQMEGIDVVKLIDHIDAAQAQTKKLLGTFKKGGRDYGEKRCREYLLAFETMDFLLGKLLEGVQR